MKAYVQDRYGSPDVLGLREGQHVLVNGASGGVGTFAVQLARTFGAEVTGVCSGRNAELVTSLGAKRAIDYTRDDFTSQGEIYDLILEAVGNRTVGDCMKALRPGGICVVVGYTSMSLMLRAQMKKGRIQPGDRHVAAFTAKADRSDLVYLASLAESGKVKSVIERTYSFDDLPEALA